MADKIQRTLNPRTSGSHGLESRPFTFQLQVRVDRLELELYIQLGRLSFDEIFLPGVKTDEAHC